MKTLYVICLAVLFHSISSEIIDNENDKVQKQYTDRLKTLEERVLSLTKNPEFCNMMRTWYKMLAQKISNSDDKGEKYRFIKARKGVNYTKQSKNNQRTIREAENERQFRDPFEALTGEYIPKLLREISKLTIELISKFTKELIQGSVNDNNPNSNVQLKCPTQNLNESTCDVLWNMEKIQPPLELIDSLPSCLCTYPGGDIIKVNDQKNAKEYWWQKVSNTQDKCGPTHCLKIEVENNENIVSKYCCYDENYSLITRGPNAGNIHYLNTSNLKNLIHKAFKSYPAVKCNIMRLIKSIPVSNDNGCKENPYMQMEHRTSI
ncbi:uncharacterized protein LOC116843906 isoform X2 [Odontomachus brunneus]|uniref:uncharacterized protein LOC116843846 isoform X2 n=1 Tax=Odontomachus brunneus TaxID=486640 RepID=UPI0013F1A5CF|nr:uncharacterized protein LOC116843846 isoform X2 [Odontomachus brunneus]XP_032670707.1 uncharacterized protein LOC116843906 isoform X2 [Odontomachus brunneus]